MWRHITPDATERRPVIGDGLLGDRILVHQDVPILVYHADAGKGAVVAAGSDPHHLAVDADEPRQADDDGDDVRRGIPCGNRDGRRGFVSLSGHRAQCSIISDSRYVEI